MKNNFHIIKVALMLILTFCVNGCTDVDDNLFNEFQNIASKETFNKNSEIAKVIEKAIANSSSPSTEKVCLDFVYPFKVFLYDVNLAIIGERVLVGDSDFSTFLDGLNPNQQISISYPIKTTLLNGTIFTVNNNSELKIALESCTNADIINYYSGLFGGNGQTQCVWRVPYDENYNNKYAGGVFEANNDGTIKFNFENINYIGIWSFLFVNDEFQININLAGTSIVAQDWNISRKLVYSNNLINSTIIIDGTPQNIILEQVCEKSINYQLGSVGPAGGIVFYDKGFYSLGWRYLEAAPVDLGFYEWGCSGSFIKNTFIDIGRGFNNSVKIVNYHNSLINYYLNPSVCNALNNGTVVSKNTLLYSINNYKDWYLPSEKELEKMYLNLKLKNLGAFGNNIYWSSSEIDADFVNSIDFNSGLMLQTRKIPNPNNIKVRAIRNF